MTIEEKGDVEKTLEQSLASAKSLGGVMILELNKDGSQRLLTSSLSMHEKAFLVAFAQAYINEWFKDAMHG